MGYELTGTHNHPVLVLDASGEKKWKRLDALEVGDFVAVQRHAPLFANDDTLPSFEQVEYASRLSIKD
jgi:intein/homing endonuclease